MRRKKPEEKVTVISKIPRLLLYKSDLIGDLNKAVLSGQYKMTALDKQTFPSQLQLDLIRLSINKDKPEIIQWLDSSNENTLGVSNDYMSIWKQTAAGFINKDIKSGIFDVWYIITFNSREGIKKALVRNLDDKLDTPNPIEYKDLIIQYSNNNIINFTINNHMYTILKIVGIDETWTVHQKTYDEWDLLDSYEMVEPPETEDDQLVYEEEQEELF